MQGDDHIASTLKRCCSNARVILKIVNIFKVLKTPHPKIRSISIIPSFKSLNATRLHLETVKLFKLKKLQKFLSCLTAFEPLSPPPTPHTHTVPSATTLWDTFIITYFLGRPFANDKWDKGIMEAHPKAFASTRLQ